jgi:hypothetical protein
MRPRLRWQPQQSQVRHGSDGPGFRSNPKLHRARSGPFRVRIEARQRWVASTRVSSKAWLEADQRRSVTKKKMTAENARGVRRSLAHDESAREKQNPLTLRNEAQLNCVSLRPEFDCEVTWGTVKGQDERPLRGALDSSPSHHRRSMQLGKELNYGWPPRRP